MVGIKYLMEIAKLIEHKRERRALAKVNDVRQEIIDLNEEIKTIPHIQKETKKVMAEKVGRIANIYLYL
jgi:hypothetical protein